MSPREGVLSAIGCTPLIRLNRIAGDAPVQVFAKLEAANPGGSIKDRPARRIIENAISNGLVKAGGLVIESSSGNMAIALAQACVYFGLRLICVVDPKATRQNLQILEAYGVEINLVSTPDPTSGEFLVARLNRVRELLRVFPEAFWPDQYSNTDNSDAHHHTMKEIATSLHWRVDYLFCPTSTCGTLRGCTEFIRLHRMKTKVYAVDALGSIIFGAQSGKRLIPGHGAGVRPGLFQPDLADRLVLVSDIESITGCRRLVQSEAILAGGSSGAVAIAFDRLKYEIPRNSICVLIFPDRGERYLDTIYSDVWVHENFADFVQPPRRSSHQEQLDKSTSKQQSHYTSFY
jgi:2,3-diaminopropionate biosynthesis protein SbnA